MLSFREVSFTKVDRLRFLLFLLVIFSSQVLAFEHSVSKNFFSPFTTKTGQSIMLSGTLSTGLIYSNRKHLTLDFEERMRRDEPLGKYATVGDFYGRVVPNAVYAMAFWAWGNDEGKLKAEHMAFTTLYSCLLTNILKYTVREERPVGHSKNSFPSGHTTSAFAFASVIGIQHEWYYAVPAYALATFTGLSRVNDGKHFVHDVLAGATIGMAYGYGIAAVNQERFHLSSSLDWRMFPVLTNDSTSLYFTLNY